MGTKTSTTTLAEAIPTIVAAALLELSEGNIVQPLVTTVDFSGPGYVHQTPFVTLLTAETDDSADYQALDTGGSLETSPSAATVGAHNAYVLLSDLSAMASVGDMAAAAGQLIGQALTLRRDLDLVTLFTSFVTNQGSTSGATSAVMAPGDLYDAYGSLRAGYAPLPYHLVLHPTHIWSANGISAMFDNSSDALSSAGYGTVGEEWTRYGFAGLTLGFNVWSDTNISFTSNLGSGAAFSKAAIKYVTKRDLFIEIQRNAPEVSDAIVGSGFWGEAILRGLHGNEMRFRNNVAVGS